MLNKMESSNDNIYCLAKAAKLFKVNLTLIDIICEPTIDKPWSSRIYKVADSKKGTYLIYKSRRVLSQELIEIEKVLDLLSEYRFPHICTIVDFALHNQKIHLLLEFVEGRSLDHYHDCNWNNDPEFSKYLRRLPLLVKTNIAIQILESLDALHNKSLLFQDLKLEQLLLRATNEVTFVDIDTIVLRDGLCARSSVWRSPSYSPMMQDCNVYTDIYQAGCILHELFTNRHLDGDSVMSGDIGVVVNKMTTSSEVIRYNSAAEVLRDLRRAL